MTMRGKDYVAVVGLGRKVDGAFDPASETAIGETCERVDPKSLPWLLEQGLIKPVVVTPMEKE